MRVTKTFGATEQSSQLSEVGEDIDDCYFFLHIWNNHTVDDLHVGVHQRTSLGGIVNLSYLILDLLRRTLLEESHKIPLFLRSYVDHVLRAAHIAEKRLQLSCCFDLLFLANNSETSSCEELIIEIS